MPLDLLFVLVVLLVAALAMTGHALYREKKEPEGAQITAGKQELTVKEK